MFFGEIDIDKVLDPYMNSSPEMSNRYQALNVIVSIPLANCIFNEDGTFANFKE